MKNRARENPGEPADQKDRHNQECQRQGSRFGMCCHYQTDDHVEDSQQQFQEEAALLKDLEGMNGLEDSTEGEGPPKHEHRSQCHQNRIG